MPDSGHVIACARLLRNAHEQYKLMVASGNDGGLALNNEIRKWSNMDAAGKQAASVWVDFLSGLADPGWYGNEEDS